jgi:hypothetical protein
VSTAEPSERDAVDVVYLPYLPLRERITVGEWELIPRAALAEADCVYVRTIELAQGLGAVYALPEQAGTSAGAFARSRGRRVGEEIANLPDLQGLRDLQRACTVAVLDVNPSPLVPESERDLNAGHWMLTSDNALVVAHGIDRKLGYTGTIIGSRLPLLSFGVSVLDDPDQGTRRATIPPPGGLRIPTFRTLRLDVEYADAAWHSIRRNDDGARRLQRAIDWLNLAWLNATGLTDELRVPALRAGFEVLLDSEDAEELAKRLGRLLDDTTPIRHRRWTSTITGDERSANMREVPWWFMGFSFLRNDLMHGRAPGEEKWVRDDRSQTDLGEWYLRQAIKHTVANAGHPDILDEPLWRDARRAARDFLRAQQPDEYEG